MIVKKVKYNLYLGCYRDCPCEVCRALSEYSNDSPLVKYLLRLNDNSHWGVYYQIDLVEKRYNNVHSVAYKGSCKFDEAEKVLKLANDIMKLKRGTNIYFILDVERKNNIFNRAIQFLKNIFTRSNSDYQPIPQDANKKDS